MATYVIGLLILVLLFLAGRHVFNSLRTGGHDCCGCSGCSGCSNGHSAGEAESTAKAGCSCCALHK